MAVVTASERIARYKAYVEEKKRKKKEREARKKEKAKEKEKQRKVEKRKEKSKKLRIAANKRAYARRRAKQLEERAAVNDVYGFHMVLIMNNGKRMGKTLCKAWWYNTCRDVYEAAIKENEEGVLFPKEILQDTAHNGIRKANYEIMIVRKVEEGKNTIRQFRNDSGKLVDNIIVDDNSHDIICKHKWLVEETFHVFGYHPVKDRKDAHFIVDEMLLQDNERENIKRIFTYQNKLVIQTDENYDYVLCKTPDDAHRLLRTLKKHLSKHKYLIFNESRKITGNALSVLLNDMEEKFGRNRKTCRNANWVNKTKK